MSIERCTDCGRNVDTDFEDVTYYEELDPVAAVCDVCEIVRQLEKEGSYRGINGGVRGKIFKLRRNG